MLQPMAMLADSASVKPALKRDGVDVLLQNDTRFRVHALGASFRVCKWQFHRTQRRDSYDFA